MDQHLGTDRLHPMIEAMLAQARQRGPSMGLTDLTCLGACQHALNRAVGLAPNSTDPFAVVDNELRPKPAARKSWVLLAGESIWQLDSGLVNTRGASNITDGEGRPRPKHDVYHIAWLAGFAARNMFHLAIELETMAQTWQLNQNTPQTSGGRRPSRL